MSEERRIAREIKESMNTLENVFTAPLRHKAVFISVSLPLFLIGTLYTLNKEPQYNYHTIWQMGEFLYVDARALRGLALPLRLDALMGMSGTQSDLEEWLREQASVTNEEVLAEYAKQGISVRAIVPSIKYRANFGTIDTVGTENENEYQQEFHKRLLDVVRTHLHAARELVRSHFKSEFAVHRRELSRLTGFLSRTEESFAKRETLIRKSIQSLDERESALRKEIANYRDRVQSVTDREENPFAVASTIRLNALEEQLASTIAKLDQRRAELIEVAIESEWTLDLQASDIVASEAKIAQLSAASINLALISVTSLAQRSSRPVGPGKTAYIALFIVLAYLAGTLAAYARQLALAKSTRSIER